MTLLVTFTVHCDWVDCEGGDPCPASFAIERAGADHVRRKARDAGWRRLFRKARDPQGDYCPEHAPHQAAAIEERHR